MTRTCVIGTGYVGLATAACPAKAGRHVMALDVDQGKLGKLAEAT